MNVQNVKMVVGFFNWSSKKHFEGTIFLNFDPKTTVWHEEVKKVLVQKGYIDESVKKVLVQKGYIDESYQYEKREYGDCEDALLLVTEYEPEVELRPLWVEGDILTNE